MYLSPPPPPPKKERKENRRKTKTSIPIEEFPQNLILPKDAKPGKEAARRILKALSDIETMEEKHCKEYIIQPNLYHVCWLDEPTYLGQQIPPSEGTHSLTSS